MTTVHQDVRSSPLAGQWYPANARRLRSSIEDMLAEAEEPVSQQTAAGLVAPHAGVRYSGPVAAGAFRAIRGRSFERVVIISPMHHPYDGDVLTTGHDAYETPLGAVPVDGKFIAAMNDRQPLRFIRDDPEHAIEIELPFLQVTLTGSFMLVPLMLRDQSYSTAERVAKNIVEIIKEPAQTLLVASSDLSHFYTEEQAHQLDRVMLDQIEAFDPAGVIRVEEEERAFACGRGAIAAVLLAAQHLGAEEAKIVAYGTSADTGAGKDRVVGYGAAVIY